LPKIENFSKIENCGIFFAKKGKSWELSDRSLDSNLLNVRYLVSAASSLAAGQQQNGISSRAALHGFFFKQMNNDAHDQTRRPGRLKLPVAYAVIVRLSV